MPNIKEQVTKRGVYVLPSLFTSMGLFAGFYSLIAAIQGRYELAAWAIIAAAVFDMLDGRVARLLHAETAFGAEYDSLCDMLSFGIAPAVLVYLWVLVELPSGLHKLAWLGAFFLAACAALRLARFNVQLENQDKRYFQGLPTPAAALLIVTGVLFHAETNIEPWPWVWFTASLILAWLMVSNVRFVSGKDIDLRKQRKSGFIVGMIVIGGLVMAYPYQIPFAFMLAYCLHGPMVSLWQHHRLQEFRMKRKLAKKQAAEASQHEAQD